MKKLLLPIIAFTFAGCMHYATPHGQDITLKNIERLPAKAGLYIPKTISKDSVFVSNGAEIFETHIYFLLRSGAAMANAIEKAVTVSVNEVKVYDTLPSQNQCIKDSLTFLIIPEFTKRKSTLWMTFDHPTAFEAELKLTFTKTNHEIIDSVRIHAIGVRSDGDNTDRKDTIIADAADSAIASLQDQIVYQLTRNTQLRSYLGAPNSANDIAIVTPATHGLYGKESRFRLDTTSYDLIPIPRIRRWAEWFEDGFDSDLRLHFAFGVDLLLHSEISFRVGIACINNFERQGSYYSFSESRFINPDPIVRRNWSILAQTSYLFFGPRHFLETGVRIDAVVGKITISHVERFIPSAIIGYRYQPILSGLCFGISYTPYLDLNGIQFDFSLGVGVAF
jgi:hypothetical protein